jgi:hypothetical protein
MKDLLPKDHIQSICVISEDTKLLVRLIDWLNRQTPDESKSTTIYVCEGDVTKGIKNGI